jgi:hypothetical protein
MPPNIINKPLKEEIIKNQKYDQCSLVNGNKFKLKRNIAPKNNPPSKWDLIN